MQLATKVFPCHVYGVEDEINMKVEHEGSNHMHKVADSNGDEYGAIYSNNRADDNGSHAPDSFWDTPWLYGRILYIVSSSVKPHFFLIYAGYFLE